MRVVHNAGWQVKTFLDELAQLKACPTGEIVGCRKDRTISGVNRTSAGNAESDRMNSPVVRHGQHLFQSLAETDRDHVAPSAGFGGNLRRQCDFASRINERGLDTGSANVRSNRGCAGRLVAYRANKLRGDRAGTRD